MKIGSMILILALSVSPVIAQLIPAPAWANDPFVLAPELSHPAFVNVRQEWQGYFARQHPQVTSHVDNFVLSYHSSHGEIVVQERGNDKYTTTGAIATGLTYIFNVQSVDATKSGNGSLNGLFVVGLNDSGNSELMYGAWPSGVPASTVTFSRVAVAPTGMLWTRASIVGANAYVFDAVSGEIHRLIDTDSDSIPDTVSPLSVDVDSLDKPEAVIGFSYRQGTSEHLIFFGAALARNEYHRLTVGGNAFQVETVALDDMALFAPSLMSEQPVVGQLFVRVYYEPGRTVQVFADKGAGPVPISGQFVLDVLRRNFVDVRLKEKFQNGWTITVQDTVDVLRTSIGYDVSPKSHIVFRDRMRIKTAGEGIVISGEHFQPGSTTVVVTVDGELIVGHPFSIKRRKLTPASISLTVPSLPAGKTFAFLRVDITDSRFPAIKRQLSYHFK